MYSRMLVSSGTTSNETDVKRIKRGGASACNTTLRKIVYMKTAKLARVPSGVQYETCYR